MSSVPSIGSELSNLYKALQQAANPNAAQSATPQAADPNAATTQSSETQPRHHHHGAHGLRSQIETAVTDALKSSDGSKDPNQVIQDAIASVFAKLQQGGAAATTAGTPSSGTTTTPSATSSQADQQAFAQLLQSYGIDQQQFKQDMQSAIQSVNGGTLDFSKLFRSFPAGSAVDATA